MIRFGSVIIMDVVAVFILFLSFCGHLFCVYGAEEYFELNGECTNPSGERGICLKIGRCKHLLELLTKNKSKPNSTVIDFIWKSNCGFDGIHPIVCCPLEKKQKKNGEERLNSVEGQKSTKVRPSVSCGTIQESNRIVGGSATTLSEFPWMALIGYKTRLGLQFQCGGSLVSSRYVLTAAHCISPDRQINSSSVRLGEYNLGTKKDCMTGLGCAPLPVDVDIEKVILHPDYSKPELRNDIALIRLAETVKIGKSIQPICLPANKSFSERSFSHGKKGVIAGWGTTETGTKSQVLLKAEVPLVPRTECSEIYKRKLPITESQICAGGEPGRDSCGGDSGGPLQMVGVNDLGQPVYVQEGIVSFGPRNCGETGKPGVYTKVAHYADWILENLKD